VTRARRVSLAVVLLVGLAVVPGVVAADRRAGGSVVVGPGEEVSGLTATGGSVVVYGTVAGDLDAYAGTVRIAPGGRVTGSVRAYAGSVRIEGTVDGRVVAYGGSVHQTANATVGGSLGAVAGDVTVAGTVRGDVAAATSSLGLAYDGRLDAAPGATVGGQTRSSEDLDLGPAPPALPPGTLLVYGVLTNLLVGYLLLRGLGGFSVAVVETAALDPLPSVGWGLVAVVAAPLALLALALTVVGIPVAVVALLALPAVGWIGAIYGRFAVGAYLLSLVERDEPVQGLVLGVVLVALLGAVPVAGPVVRIAVGVLGLGAVGIELADRVGERSPY
jgi:cytoskeletal protein CcmA (bactofilin family)